MINLGKEGKEGVGIGKKQTEAHSCTVGCDKCGCKGHRSSVLTDVMVPEQSSTHCYSSGLRVCCPSSSDVAMLSDDCVCRVCD